MQQQAEVALVATSLVANEVEQGAQRSELGMPAVPSVPSVVFSVPFALSKHGSLSDRCFPDGSFRFPLVGTGPTGKSTALFSPPPLRWEGRWGRREVTGGADREGGLGGPLGRPWTMVRAGALLRADLTRSSEKGTVRGHNLQRERKGE